jgi:hypothetical protein
LTPGVRKMLLTRLTGLVACGSVTWATRMVLLS